MWPVCLVWTGMDKLPSFTHLLICSFTYHSATGSQFFTLRSVRKGTLIEALLHHAMICYSWLLSLKTKAGLIALRCDKPESNFQSEVVHTLGVAHGTGKVQWRHCRSPTPQTPRKDSQMRVLPRQNTNRTIYVVVVLYIFVWSYWWHETFRRTQTQATIFTESHWWLLKVHIVPRSTPRSSTANVTLFTWVV